MLNLLHIPRKDVMFVVVMKIKSIQDFLVLHFTQDTQHAISYVVQCTIVASILVVAS